MSKIAVIGVGNMGFAYVQSLVKKGLAQKSEVLLYDVSEERISSLKQEGYDNSFTQIDASLSGAGIVVLAVKPQFFAEMAAKAKEFIHSSQLLVSIMAGVKIRVIEKHLLSTSVVRAMPNTPCMLNQGITGVFVSGGAKRNDNLEQARTVLASTGRVIEVDSEENIDAVTAISGSGPAYFYYFVQQISEQGEKLGLSKNVAEQLANHTMKGAFHMIEEKGEKSLQDLIDAVTSKGGTTFAALDTMKELRVGESLQKAVNAANTRAGELSDMIEKQ